MTDKKQLGLRVDPELFEQFKQTVEERRGRWQGAGGEEMEKAMRAYIHGEITAAGGNSVEQMNARLSRIERAVGVEAADGGLDTSEPAQHTHTPIEAPDEKPHAQAPKEKKIRWLAKRVREDVVPSGTEARLMSIAKTEVRELVKDEYSFRADTAKEYVDDLIDHFDLVSHPDNDVVYMTEQRREQLLEKRREQRRQEAAEETDTQ
jgi:hypothetical protein